MLNFQKVANLNRKKNFWISFTLAILALAAGSWGVIQVIIYGNHGSLTSYVPWGLWVGVYVYLVWLEVGMILSFFICRRFLKVEGIKHLGPVVMLAAISALLGALFAIGMDLGHPFRFWKAYFQPQLGSLMTWMIWLHTLYLFILVGELWAYKRGREFVDKYEIYLNFLTYISIPFGVLLIAVIGGLFGVVAARPFWNASVLPLMFFIASLIAGLGLLTVLHLLFSPRRGTEQYVETAQTLGRLFLGAMLIGAIASLANGLVIAYPNVPAYAEGLRMVLFGPFWWTIWIIHLGFGLLIPVVLLAFFRKNLTAIAIATGFYVLAFTMVPVNIIIPGLAYPMPAMEGLREAFHHTKLSFGYTPSIVEWLVVLFAVGFSLFIFSIGYRYIIEPYFIEHQHEFLPKVKQ
ncbi:MAG: polysulfide reductase NrfD [Rhodothermaceae bacterium]|nr:polysulfide reductase NrfD [Rhodothermaceae bacterium]